MASEKLTKAIITETNGVRSFAPERPELIDPRSTNIHPDKDGVMWYWTPEPEIPVDAE